MAQNSTSIARGKIILGGEHAVVYGCPALVMAIERFCQVKLQAVSHQAIDFNLPDYNWQRSFTKKDLLELQRQIEERYQSFLCGKISGDDVLDEPAMLTVYATVFFAQHLLPNDFNRALDGLDINVSSSIPIGCGMGSSAALIVALGSALQKYFAQEISSDVFLAWSKEIENLQHGHSSGVDLYLAYHGGAVLFDKDGVIKKRNMPQIPFNVINTGVTSSTTGECVMYVKQFFKMPYLVDDFVAVVSSMDEALQNNDCVTVHKCVRENNKLLCYIGVVPAKVRQFIAEVEQRGLAAKISGSGAVRGDTAGIVLVFGDNCDNKIDDLLVKYKYRNISY